MVCGLSALDFLIYYYRMIASLSGTVLRSSHDSIVVDVQGVGYRVFVTPEENRRHAEGHPVFLHTYLAVRENAMDLYGFSELRDLQAFELLLTVSGIGPKSALSVLSLVSTDTLRSAVMSGDAGYLTKVSGVGKKTAEKIVLELKDKGMLLSGDAPHTVAQGDEEALEALRAMGYTLQEARDALKRVSKETVGSSARLKEALQQLG